MSKRKVVYAAIYAAATSGSVAAAVALMSPASGGAAAYPVCVGVSTTGTVIGNHTVGPICALNLPATKCTSVEAGFVPEADAIVYTCLPN